MIYSQFDQFLKEVLKLPVTVFEGPSFSYTEQTARTCFAQHVGKTLPVTFCGFIFAVNFFSLGNRCMNLVVFFTTETGFSEHVPGHLDVRSSATVSCMVATYASAG